MPAAPANRQMKLFGMITTRGHAALPNQPWKRRSIGP
jgi:hypothetical protein